MIAFNLNYTKPPDLSGPQPGRRQCTMKHWHALILCKQKMPNFPIYTNWDAKDGGTDKDPQGNEYGRPLPVDGAHIPRSQKRLSESNTLGYDC